MSRHRLINNGSAGPKTADFSDPSSLMDVFKILMLSRICSFIMVAVTSSPGIHVRGVVQANLRHLVFCVFAQDIG